MTPYLDAVAEALGPLALRDVPLGPLTTYRVGGAASVFVTATSVDDLRRVRDVLVSAPPGLPVLVVGRGSNLLVADRGLAGVAVQLGGAFDAVDRPEAAPTSDSTDDVDVVAGGAVSLPVLARQLAGAGIVGFEWAVGVPGSVGGAVRMNAGGHGSDMASWVRRATIVDLAGGRDGTVQAPGLSFGYRRSSVSATEVVCDATLALSWGDGQAARAELAEIVRWRREHQPGGQNAGSVFANPPGDAAGRLIEAAGAKGLRVGTAKVSPKHANFIQADPAGRADDVLATIHAVRARVADHGGVDLRTELRLVGFTAAELRGLPSDHVAEDGAT